jgi:hypothetical protein
MYNSQRLDRNEWEGYVRNHLWQNLSYYFDIFLEALKKSTKNLSVCSRFPADIGTEVRNVPG